MLYINFVDQCKRRNFLERTDITNCHSEQDTLHKTDLILITPAETNTTLGKKILSAK